MDNQSIAPLGGSAVPVGKEICDQCGGDGHIDAGQWGESGCWHACYRCGTTGYVPAGSQELEAQS